MNLLAALAVALAVALLIPPVVRPAAVRAAPGAGRRPVPVLLLAPLVALPAAVLHGHQLVLVLIGLGVALGGQRLLHRRRAARVTQFARAQVQAFCEALAAELAAGRPPLQVLTRSAVEFPELAAVATAARLAADVPASMRRLAEEPGRGELLLVAAAWQVAHRTGAGLAVALDRIGDTLRERRRTSRLVASELAAAHATAQMMAGLPVVFWLAGSGLGGNPVGFLTGTSAGLGCLASGLVLSYVGLAWLQRISDAVGS